MTPTYTRAPFDGYTTFFKLTGAKYDEMVRTGVIEEDDRVELLDGYMVQKMAGNPPHDSTAIRADRRLDRAVPAGWVVRSQVGTRLTHSRPEPDAAVARGDDRTYDARHPGRPTSGWWSRCPTRRSTATSRRRRTSMPGTASRCTGSST